MVGRDQVKTTCVLTIYSFFSLFHIFLSVPILSTVFVFGLVKLSQCYHLILQFIELML